LRRKLTKRRCKSFLQPNVVTNVSKRLGKWYNKRCDENDSTAKTIKLLKRASDSIVSVAMSISEKARKVDN